MYCYKWSWLTVVELSINLTLIFSLGLTPTQMMPAGLTINKSWWLTSVPCTAKIAVCGSWQFFTFNFRLDFTRTQMMPSGLSINNVRHVAIQRFIIISFSVWISPAPRCYRLVWPSTTLGRGIPAFTHVQHRTLWVWLRNSLSSACIVSIIIV